MPVSTFDHGATLVPNLVTEAGEPRIFFFEFGNRSAHQ